jgi:hypothetical protein
MAAAKPRSASNSSTNDLDRATLSRDGGALRQRLAGTQVRAGGPPHADATHHRERAPVAFARQLEYQPALLTEHDSGTQQKWATPELAVPRLL